MYKGKSISVAVATYNGDKYLKEQLESICSQTIIPDEIVISDDGSTDKTETIVNEIINKYASDSLKISFIRNNGIHGVCKNFENALMNCAGDYIFLSDQDDIWMGDKVKKVIHIFEQEPTALCVAHDAILVDRFGNKIDGIINNEVNGERLELPINDYAHLSKNEWLEFSVTRSLVNGMVMCITSSFLQKCLPFPNVRFHDQWISYMSIKNDGFYFLNEFLAKYRLHGSNTCGNRAYRGNMFQILKKKQEKFLKNDNSYTLVYLPISYSIREDLEKSGMSDTSAYTTAKRIEEIGKTLFKIEIASSLYGLVRLVRFFQTDMRYRRTGRGQFIYEFIYILLTSRRKRVNNLKQVTIDEHLI